MGHTLGDGIIVAAPGAAFVAYLYFRLVERQRRLEIVHQERLAAMEKGIPLPEFPLDPPRVPAPYYATRVPVRAPGTVCDVLPFTADRKRQRLRPGSRRTAAPAPARQDLTRRGR